MRDHWTAHYSRAIENQLDVAHLPFVHQTTIGRGNQTLVNGPVYRVRQVPSGARMDIWFDNAVDRGQPPRPASEMPEPTRRPLLQFLFPNLWQNWLGDALRIVIAFVPIDDTNTRMYIRGYQAIARAPILREAFNVTNAIGNFVIERQDRWAVITQRPKRSDLRGGEKLIPGDGPIIEYRRIRQALIEQAGQWSNP